MKEIEEELVDECQRLMQQRIENIMESEDDLQSMLSRICDLDVELTERPDMLQAHLPIRKKSLEGLTILLSNVSETVKRNQDASADLDQRLQDTEATANSSRKQLFNVSRMCLFSSHD